jgi:uncharacterized protein YndB with AHSA1/START domain
MTTREAGGQAVIVRRRMAASRREVFNAWTDAEGMRIWMCPGDIVSATVQLDPRVGGAFRIVMQSATTAFEHWGEFTVVDPPSKLAFTWYAKATDFQPTLVTVELYDAGNDQCDLVLTHERFQRPAVGDQYRGGWGQIVTRLSAYLQEHR